MLITKGGVQSKKKKSVENSTLGGGVSPRSFFHTFFKVCRMVQFVQKCKEKFFSFRGGGGGVPLSPQLRKIYENFLSVFGFFQGEKIIFSKVAQNVARSLKKIGCIFPH